MKYCVFAFAAVAAAGMVSAKPGAAADAAQARAAGIAQAKAALAVTSAAPQGIVLWRDIEEKEAGGVTEMIWKHVGGKPMQNRFKGDGDIPAKTAMSEGLSKELKQRGFNFVGPVIVYAFAQAVGMVNDHTTKCFRHAECAKLAKR